MSRLAYVALRWLTPRLQEHGRGAERSQRSAGNKRGFHPVPVRGAHHFAKICSASSAIVVDKPKRASRGDWLLLHRIVASPDAPEPNVQDGSV